jgi:hypothetical protein
MVSPDMASPDMASPDMASPRPVTPHTVTRDIAQAGLIRMVGTLAVFPPCLALVQTLANAHEYRYPVVAIMVWPGVLAAAAWLVPRLRDGGLSAQETAAAIAIAVAAVTLVALSRQAHAMPGSVDLAILGTVWLLVLVVVSRSAWVWIPAALSLFALHGALLVRTEGLNRLSLSELEAAGYISAAILITFAALRPTVAVHASMAARRSSLASKSAAERAAAAAIAQERRSRLAVLEKEALPLLRGIADGTLDATAADVRDDCARHAAALRHSLTGRPPGTGGLTAALEPALRAARERGLLVDVQLIGDPGPPPPPLARAVQATVAAVLGALPPQQVTLTVLADGDTSIDDGSGDDGSGDDGSGDGGADPSDPAANDRGTNDRDASARDGPGDDLKGNDVEMFLTFDAPPEGIPDLTRFGLDLPAAARWHASVSTAVSATAGGGYLEVSWRKDGAR